jgi:phosphocarrier protein
MNGETTSVRSPARAVSRALLRHADGLHARPAIKLTKLAKRFRCVVRISLDERGPWVDAKSIARVMAMKTPQMSTLHFAAEGDDAREAVEALAKLVESDFADHDDAA